MDRVEYKHDELDKEALNDLIKAKIESHKLERKLAESNIEKARLAIQLI